MKKKYHYLLLALLPFTIWAQNKKWTLDQCVQHALANNILTKQAALNIETATIDKKGAIGNFLPSANINASNSWNIGLNQDVTTGVLKNQTSQFSSLSGTIEFDIYKGLQNQNQLRKANLSLLAAKYNSEKIKEDVALNVINAFLQILFAKENLKIQEEQKIINEKQFIRSEELVKAGTLPRGDLLENKANLAAVNQKIIVAQNSLLLSKLALAQLLQLQDFNGFEVSDVVKPSDLALLLAQSPVSIFDKAKEQRPLLKIAEINLDISQRDVAIAKGAYQPVLRGFYSLATRASYNDVIRDFVLNTTNPTSPIGFVQNTNQTVVQSNVTPVLGSAPSVLNQFDTNKGQSFGFQLSVPVFNGFSVKNNVARAKVNLEKLKLTANQQELDLQRTVYAAYTDTKAALSSHEAAIEALKAREEAVVYAKEKYKIGMMNSFDFGQAQVLLSNAQTEELKAKYDYFFKLKILEYYFGIPLY
jgi:outer membrane protein TolC